MSLADNFSDQGKSDFASLALRIGTVLRMYVPDVTPPKYKYFVIVGFSGDELTMATVYINSKVNKKVNWSHEMQDLQIPITPDEAAFLRHNSFVDCSKLNFRETENLQQAIRDKPEIVAGTIPESKLKTILAVIKGAPTIKGKYKKRYGFYD